MFSLQAFSVGNPSNPSLLQKGIFIPDTSWVNVRLGAEAEVIKEKRLTFNSLLNNSFVRARYYSGSCTLNIKERLDLGFNLGTSRVDLKADFQSESDLDKTDVGYLFKAFAKLIIFELRNTTLSFDARFSQSKGNTSEFLQTNDTASLRLKQWQVAAGLTKNFGIFFPYIAGTYNDTQLKIKPTGLRNIRGEQKEKLGLVVGMTLTNHLFFMFNAEGQFFSETSFNLSGEIRF
ncbi:MAG: hypothetical protein COT84_00150 [Chlamydiae bacterium CG10_big_fil_rev_8_21_14_0_10_35_9]|nr:MAG: hypothetical protein COT84_00150 [Chlamydiae bacterium CG10_big_fil_rev_8_21_14_0_10_35_9]